MIGLWDLVYQERLVNHEIQEFMGSFTGDVITQICLNYPSFTLHRLPEAVATLWRGTFWHPHETITKRVSMTYNRKHPLNVSSLKEIFRNIQSIFQIQFGYISSNYEAV